jgi:hypothetical protein
MAARVVAMGWGLHTLIGILAHIAYVEALREMLDRIYTAYCNTMCACSLLMYHEIYNAQKTRTAVV